MAQKRKLRLHLYQKKKSKERGNDMTVTSIIPLDKRRSKVFLDEDFALALYKGEIRKYHLEEGAFLEPETYREILETILYKRARERVLYLLKGGDRTEADIRGKLKEGCYPQEAIDHAISFLKEYRYIDDERYARHYIESRGSRKSSRQISYDLQQKGLPRDVVSQLLENNPVKEEEQIEKFLKKKGYDKNRSTREEKAKIAAALGRKGFSFDCIRKKMEEDFDNETS